MPCAVHAMRDVGVAGAIHHRVFGASVGAAQRFSCAVHATRGFTLRDMRRAPERLVSIMERLVPPGEPMTQDATLGKKAMRSPLNVLLRLCATRPRRLLEQPTVLEFLVHAATAEVESEQLPTTSAVAMLSYLVAHVEQAAFNTHGGGPSSSESPTLCPLLADAAAV